MRNFVWAALCLLMLAAASCDLNTKSHHTPLVQVHSMISGTDTLSVSSTVDGYVMDTVRVGDTVQFKVSFYSYENQLTAFSVECDEEKTAVEWDMTAEVDSLLRAGASDFEHGLFRVPAGYCYIGFRFRYIPTEAADDLSILFTVDSDSNYPHSDLTLRTPVGAAAE